MTANCWENENLIRTLKAGGVAVMPTDTIYGIVGSALKPDTVGRIYAIRKRNLDKRCIILISDITELEKFGIHLPFEEKNLLRGYWPALPRTKEDKKSPVSIIIDCPGEEFSYLHRSTNTLAFRVPEDGELKFLLASVGPLVAPSANTEGMPPARNIGEARKYFGDQVDLYIDGGEISGNASKVIKLNSDGSATVLRP